MAEIILSLTALLLGLFCLIHSVRHSRELRSPLPGGMPGALSRRAVYPAMLVTFAIDALVSIVEKAGPELGLSPGIQRLPGTIHIVLQIILLILFVVYAANVLNRRRSEKPSQKGTGWLCCCSSPSPRPGQRFA